MKPQAEAFLEKSRELLENAATMLRVDLNEDAGRTAYLAGFHAAQAFLFEKTGTIFKTHSGVQGEFGRRVKGDPRFDPDLGVFLGRSYGLKITADYEAGPGSKISSEQAAEAVAAARSFVERLVDLLDEGITETRRA